MAEKRPALIIHGHFYQPPRENPWTGVVGREPSATPFHDWNERIHDECYRRNAFARVFDDHGKVVRIVNNYASLSFNFGPTLLSWLGQRHPQTLVRILQADRQSLVARGHGNAIAQGYNHTILPLCNDRDMRTQIRWGVAEFQHRFRREPESLWMPETACNDRVLAALIDAGMRFALLAPGQAARVRAQGEEQWRSVEDGSIDPSRAYRYLHPDGSGRSLALFFYDGAISRAVAFEGVLGSSYDFVSRLEAASGGPGTLVHAVTDGESYGHHFGGGDRCLAYTFEEEAPQRGFWVTNYGQWLDHFPPTMDVEVKAGEDGLGTAWSCAHGVGRWYTDCGCHTGGKPDWNQRWRTPLREALNLLRDEAAAIYQDAAGVIVPDPWSLRDDYVELLLRPDGDRRGFLEQRAGRSLGDAEQVRALELLEMQRSSLLMYTSCGWFFSDVSGIETVQIMRYAAHLMEQMEQLGAASPHARFLDVLAEAKSNLPEKGNGADVFRAEVVPSRVTSASLAAHIGISSLPKQLPSAGQTAGYGYELSEVTKRRLGRLRLLTARVALRRFATGKQRDFAMAAMHFGAIDVYCVLKPFETEEAFARSNKRLWSEFPTASLLTILRIAEEEFGPDEYGIEHVLPEGRDAISRAILDEVVERYTEHYQRLHEDNRRLIAMVRDAALPVPYELRVAAEITLSRRFESELEQQQDSRDPDRYATAEELAAEAKRYGYQLRCGAARSRFEELLEEQVARVCSASDEAERSALAAAALELLELTETLALDTSTERAQERLFEAFGRAAVRSAATEELMIAFGFSPRLLGREVQVLEGPGSRRPSEL